MTDLHTAANFFPLLSLYYCYWQSTGIRAKTAFAGWLSHIKSLELQHHALEDVCSAHAWLQVRLKIAMQDTLACADRWPELCGTLRIDSHSKGALITVGVGPGTRSNCKGEIVLWKRY